MSASQRILCSLNPPPLPSSSSSIFFRFLSHCKAPARSPSFGPSACVHRSIMPRNQRRGKEQKWIQKPKSNNPMPAMASASQVPSALAAGSVTSINDHQVETRAALPAAQVGNNQFGILKPKAYGTVSGGTTVEVENESGSKGTPTQESSSGLSKLFRGIDSFSVDSTTYAHAQVRATFYPKFENEKSDQEIRTRMAEVVSKGLGTLEVSLKHSGSLFMYAGNEGGAYAKNSFGNIYTAVGVFVLGRMFQEAWGAEAGRKQAAFNDFLEKNRMCISMELVTAVLGDHGQRPREDYVVVTAVTNLGKGKPRFYSTSEIIVFCRKWRLPTNHVWLFSSRKSVASFFATYDVLCEEGTATPVCRALDQVADISVPGSKDHINAQGEILEGLVARIVSHDSSKHLEDVLKEFPLPPNERAQVETGPSLREICAANRSDEKQQMKALLKSVGSSFCPDHSDWLGGEGDNHSRNADKSVVLKFLQSQPADYSTTKLQEMISLMREKRYPAAFKCYNNFHMTNSLSSDNIFYKMVIHVHSDSAFRRYQRDMRYKPELWPLYRGFFVDINLFKATEKRAAEIAKGSQDIFEKVNGNGGISKGDLADDDANLMIKLKFLTYKIRTFLIRNGLSTLFKDGPAAYKAYYQKQMRNWGTSNEKQRQLSKMLDEWAVYIRRKCGNKQLSSSIYLSEAEVFLEQYAKRSPENQALIGSAGNLVRSEDFLAIIEGGRDEEGDLHVEQELAPPSPGPFIGDSISKDEGLIVFFPGIPGCAKSALCKELLSAPGGLGDDRPVHSLMGDLIKGRYWPKVAEEWRRKPQSIMLADKNAPNEEVWRQIEDMCRSTKSSAVPVVPDSEGTDSNPFSLDALAVFMLRVLQRSNHPGNLDKSSPNPGFVLLMFYHLYEGKSRQDFDNELLERFGSLVKIPLLKPDRNPLPDSVRSVLDEGISLYNLHTIRHGRMESTKGTYAKDWSKWEKRLRDTLSINSQYLNSVQVPFELAVKQVLDQLKSIASGEYKSPSTSTEKRKFGSIVFAAVSLPVTQIHHLLFSLAEKNPKIEAFVKDKQIENSLKKAHITLAHKRSHGVTAVASYAVFLNREVSVDITALLYNKKMAAFEVRLGSVDGENVISKNEWPHVTLWTDAGTPPKEANNLPQLFLEGKATRIEIDPPVTICGPLGFF